MPSALALILCISFVLFLLKLERKQSPNVTRVLWIPTIWLLHCGSKPLSVWFQTTGGEAGAGSSLDRTFLIILLIVALSILIRRKFDWSTAMKENPWLIVLIVFMLLSITWSNIPFISFKRWTREFLAIIMAFVVLSEPSPRQAVESILRRISYILIPFSIVLIKYFPFYGSSYGRWSGRQQWIGVTQQKNVLCHLCIIIAMFLIWSLFRRKQGRNPLVWKYQTHVEIILLLITLRLMAGPRGEIFYSATSTYALSLGLLIYIGLYLLKKFKINLGVTVLITIVAIIIIFGISSVFIGGSNISGFASTANRNANLTGRTEVWSQLLPFAMQRPIIGSGFGGFWTPGARIFFQISEGHSGYLDMLLGLGFAGIFLISLFLFSSCRKAQRKLYQDFDWGVLWICYIIMVAVHNIAESSIDSLENFLIAIILFFTVASANVFSRRTRTG
ncbi:O-antigen ligase family protein [Acidobacteriota bacterium]